MAECVMVNSFEVEVEIRRTCCAVLHSAVRLWMERIECPRIGWELSRDSNGGAPDGGETGRSAGPKRRGRGRREGNRCVCCARVSCDAPRTCRHVLMMDAQTEGIDGMVEIP